MGVFGREVKPGEGDGLRNAGEACFPGGGRARTCGAFVPWSGPGMVQPARLRFHDIWTFSPCAGMT